MEINGIFVDFDDYIIDRDGKLFLWFGGNFFGEELGYFWFINMLIKLFGLLYIIKFLGYGFVSLYMIWFVVNVGGLVSVDDFFLDLENVIIDVVGKVYFYFCYSKLKYVYLFFYGFVCFRI